jgi:hypothetical protein
MSADQQSQTGRYREMRNHLKPFNILDLYWLLSFMVAGRETYCNSH